MKRYLIETAKCDVTEGGMACGPIPGNVVATVQFKEDQKSQWLSLVEVMGIPNVYLTDQDIFDKLLAEDPDDDEFIEYANQHQIWDFNGIKFAEDYNATLSSFEEKPDNPAIPLIRYLLSQVRCDWDDMGDIIKTASGKYADELSIPTIDLEEDYEDEEDDDTEDEK